MDSTARYREALHDGPPQHVADAVIAQSAVLAKPLSDRTAYVVGLIALNGELRQKLAAAEKRASDSEANLLASSAVEQSREDRIAALEAELKDARQQHKEDIEEIYRLGQEVRRLDMLAEERMHERNDAQKKLKELGKYNGILKRGLEERARGISERKREIDRHFLRHGEDIDDTQELKDERAWLDQEGERVEVAQRATV